MGSNMTKTITKNELSFIRTLTYSDISGKLYKYKKYELYDTYYDIPIITYLKHINNFDVKNNFHIDHNNYIKLDDINLYGYNVNNVNNINNDNNNNNNNKTIIDIMYHIMYLEIINSMIYPYKIVNNNISYDNLSTLTYDAKQNCNIGLHKDNIIYGNKNEYRLVLCLFNSVKNGCYITTFLHGDIEYSINMMEGDIVMFNKKLYHKVGLLNSDNNISGKRIVSIGDISISKNNNNR
jgi:hypothetical protein